MSRHPFTRIVAPRFTTARRSVFNPLPWFCFVVTPKELTRPTSGTSWAQFAIICTSRKFPIKLYLRKRQQTDQRDEIKFADPSDSPAEVSLANGDAGKQSAKSKEIEST